MNANARLASLPALETSEIPTLVFGARTHLPYAVALVVGLGGDPALCRAWLRGIGPGISYGHDRTDRAAVLGLAASGLHRLGLPAEDLAAFPTAFQSGMTGPGRARVLGDVGASDPARWNWGFGPNACDAILILYAETPDILAALQAAHRVELQEAGATSTTIDLPKRERGAAPNAAATHRQARDLTAEPFGFADGISQPFIRGTPRARGKSPDETTPAGAFILGYEALASGYTPLSPLIARNRDPAGILPTVTGDDAVTRADLGRNGTFLVVRQLAQNVEAFHDYTREVAGRLGALPGVIPAARSPAWVAAKMLGRWQNGASLVRHPGQPGKSADNQFLFRAEDPNGLACPLGAHIRRANPRDSLTGDAAVSLEIAGRHRLLRVGRPYGKEEKPEGILFMCLNADIELQFETVQQSWLNRGDFHGLRDESDPLSGIAQDTAKGAFTIPTDAGPIRLKDVPDFVKTIGGGYFFLPSRAAIRYLAALNP